MSQGGEKAHPADILRRSGGFHDNGNEMSRSRAPGSLPAAGIAAAAVLVLVFSCRSAADLVLDDPVFLEDMVQGALAGDRFRITRSDYSGIRMLLGHPDADYRRAGVILANQAADESFLPLILDAAGDAEERVAEAAAETVRARAGEFQPLLLGLLEDEESSRRLLGLVLLGSMGPGDSGGSELASVLIRLFSDSDAEVRNRASLTFHALVGRGNPYLKAALNHVNPLTAALAYRTLGRYADPRDVPSFIAAFSDPYPAVRREAQLAALRIGGDGLSFLHTEAADASRPPDSRLAAMNVIQGLRSPESIPVLIVLLEDPDEGVRIKASGILGTYGSEAAAALIRLYDESKDESGENERVKAVRIMGEIGASESLPGLSRALADPSEAVRAAARRAMEGFGAAARPALRVLAAQEGGGTAAVTAAALLRESGDAWLLSSLPALFLLITESEYEEIQAYLTKAGAPRLKNESILSLRETWRLAEEFAELESIIAGGADPYLYVWRRRESSAAAARLSLRKSFEAMHSYFETGEREFLDTAREIRGESRELEAEARRGEEIIGEMSPEVKQRGRERLERYEELRERLVRSWEYIHGDMRPLAEAVFANRGLDPRVLSRESALLGGGIE